MPQRRPLTVSHLTERFGRTRAGALVGDVIRRVTGTRAPTDVPPAPVSHQLALPPDSAEPMRERARRSLVEARRAMSGMIGEPPVPSIALEPAGGVAPDLERLRGYLEEAERERASLRHDVAELRTVLDDLRSRLDRMEQTKQVPELPAALPTEPIQPPATATVELRDPAIVIGASLPGRVFVAGTIGTRIALMPAPDAEELAALIGRLNAETLIDHAEVLESGPDRALIRVTLRTALRWEQFGTLLERVSAQAPASTSADWSDRTLHLWRGGSPPQPGMRDEG